MGTCLKKQVQLNKSLTNNEVCTKNIPLAENFAYADFLWTEVVLVDKWKDDKGKRRLTLQWKIQ